jgi:DNA repair exonuclease SbcCD ATPase subunit
LLELVSGSIDQIKAELKQVQQWKANEVKELKKRIKQWKAQEKKTAKAEKRKEENPPKEFEQKLETLRRVQDVYSTYIPVQVGNIMINYRTYQAAIKKLKAFEIDMKVTDQEMVLSYNTNYSKGSVHLHDISKYFAEFHLVPVMRVLGDG